MPNRIHSFMILTCTLGALVAATRVEADPIAYAVGGIRTPATVDQGWLFRIDLGTGEATPVGQVTDSITPATIYNGIVGLAFDHNTGVLYAVDDQFDALLSIDPATGVTTWIGELIRSDTMTKLNAAGYGLSADSGGLLYLSFGTSGSGFGRVDKATGALLVLKTTGASRATGLATDAFDELYGVAGPGLSTATDLVDIEPLNGDHVVIGGGVGITISSRLGLAADANGQIWGIEFGGSFAEPSEVFTVDTVTGLATLGPTLFIPSSSDVPDLAESLAIVHSSPTPAPLLGPGALALLVLGLTTAGVRRLSRS